MRSKDRFITSSKPTQRELKLSLPMIDLKLHQKPMKKGIQLEM